MGRLKLGTVCAVTAIAVLALLPWGRAATNQWEPLGPPGGAVYDALFLPGSGSVAIAATAGGLYRTTDGGATWFVPDQAVASRSFIGLGVQEGVASSQVVYAMDEESNVWRSTDGGLSWAMRGRIAPGRTGYEPPSQLVHNLSVSPGDPDLVLATGHDNSLARSTDGGVTWARRWDWWSVYWVTFVPGTPGRVLVGTYDGLYVSTDAGVSWSVSTGVHDGVASLAVSGDEPGVVLAGTRAGGIERSTDGGLTWAHVADLGGSVMALAFRDGVQPVWLAGVYTRDAYRNEIYRSTDNGGTWQLVGPGTALGFGRRLAIGEGVDTVLAPTEAGLFRSSDTGQTWGFSDAGMRSFAVTSIVVASGQPGKLAVGTFGAGVTATTDGGTTWAPRAAGPRDGRIESLSGVPGNASFLASGSSWGDLATSIDWGSTWDRIWWSGYYEPIRVAFATESLGLAASGRLYRTTDGGLSWSELPAVLARDAAWAAGSTTDAVAVGGGPGLSATLSESTDGGASWNPRELPASGGDGLIPIAVALSPAEPQQVAIVARTEASSQASCSVVVSRTRGRLWLGAPAEAGSEIHPCWRAAVAWDPVVPQVLYVATDDGAAPCRSTDRGRTCLPLGSTPLPARTLALAVDPLDPATVYAGTFGHGLWVFHLIPPVIDAVTPDSVPSGSGNVSLTVSGSGFDDTCEVYADGSPLATAVVDASTLTATLPATELVSPGYRSIVARCNGVASNAKPFAVRFADVSETHWAFRWIGLLADAKVTSGCGGGRYCPGDPVTRAQMAVFLLSMRHGPRYEVPPCSGVFSDVSCPGHWAADWIEELYREGITAGCGGGKYCPSASVTRAQMAVFLLKARNGTGYVPPPCSGVFSDVPCPGHWAADWIEELYREGITAGCGGGKFCPADPVTRAQMAVLISTMAGYLVPGT